MAKTVVGLFEDQAEAQRVVSDLKSGGFFDSEITTTTSSSTSVASLLTDANIPDQDIRFYDQGVQQGDTLITVHTDDSKARTAADIMSRYNMVDIDTRAAGYRQSGRTDVGLSDLDDEGNVLQVIEEELQVGKRQVQRGGVRIHSRVTERPVEEQVTLHEERVNVERRPVNREVGTIGADAFKEQSFEVTETAEEAVVSKVARVIEEVVVGKEAQERTQTVSDTVRRQDVDVEQIPGSTTTSGTTTTGTTSTASSATTGSSMTTGSTSGATRAMDTSASDDDTYYRSYFDQNLGNSGYTYDQYQPVFRYGQALATSDTYRGKNWSDVEPEARREWETRNKGTWDEFKDSIRHAWDRATGK